MAFISMSLNVSGSATSVHVLKNIANEKGGGLFTRSAASLVVESGALLESSLNEAGGGHGEKSRRITERPLCSARDRNGPQYFS